MSDASDKQEKARNNEPESSSQAQASASVQETMAQSGVVKTEVEEDSSKDQQQQIEKKETFKFYCKQLSNPTCVECDTSMTVIEALHDMKTEKKEIVIQRADKTAVKKDFPCCLIEKDEILTITFIEEEKHATEQQTQAAISLPRTDLVTFNIKTTGGKNLIYLMKNNELRYKADYACVYAVKGEKIEDALKRDGRFTDKVFQKHCVLESLEPDSQLGNEKRYKMSLSVEYLDKKKFQIIATGDKKPDSQKKQTRQGQVNAESAKCSAKSDQGQHPGTNKIPIFLDSVETLQFLRTQYENSLKILMLQRNLKDNNEVKNFFRKEYDKSVQSFSEVFKIKKIMELSQSVCQIRMDGLALGTGFLLFGRYILTNAHVVKEYILSQDKYPNLDAAFDFELLKTSKSDDKAQEEKLVPFKKEIPAYCFITDTDNRCLDFALLELVDADEIKGRPELLKHYLLGPPPSSGGICIVGHPEGGIKRMDACYIIGKENLQEAANEHNPEFLHVITQRCIEEKWKVYENQVTYDSCFFGGSSGSPVFDERCSLIGIHTSGYVYEGEEGRTRSVMEYSYSMQPILDMIRAEAKIKGLKEIVEVLEPYRYHEPETAKQQNQDVEMKDVAGSE